MKVSDVMTKNIKVIPHNATVRDAAKLMKDIDTGFVPVIDSENVIGVITDRDIVLRCTAEGHNPNETKVEEVMTREFFFLYEDEDVTEAAKVMSDQQVRRLPVVNRQEELVGVVSLGDLSVDVNNDKMSGKTLEDISRPAKPDL
ncbi:MAG TPA: CBS domain-containing protein [Anaerolineaceae bacterium]